MAVNKSPDLPFDRSVNPYRGCEHGCAYCYARPSHEYLGFSSGLDFESRIMVKREAPLLLRRELESPRWTPQVVAMSGVTDCYQPVERRLKITRGCLEVLADFRNPVSIITKNHLVTRDIDVLRELAPLNACSVMISITTQDEALAGKLEPRASRPALRFRAIEQLASNGISAGVMVAPVIPGINEHEIPAILQAAADAGAVDAHFLVLRLPLSVEGLFTDWLDREMANRKAVVLDRLRQVRSGHLSSSKFGERHRGVGFLAEQIGRLFRTTARRAGLSVEGRVLSVAAFRRPGGNQLDLGLAGF